MHGTSQSALIAASAPVTEVTVLEDRAQVLRRGRLNLPSGRSTIRILGVAPVLGDRTLSATIRDDGGLARVVDARACRTLVGLEAQASRPEAELERLLRDAEAEHTGLEERARLLKLQLDVLGLITRQAFEDGVVDAAWNQLDPEAWRHHLDQLSSREQSLREESLAHQDAREEFEERLRDLRQRVTASDRPDLEIEASVEIDVESSSALEATLELAYLVPAACWRPQHRARLVREDDQATRLAFSSDACVWQNTGEDWNNVTLRMSTQRSSLGIEPPLLTEEVLQTRERPEQVTVEARDQEIQSTGPGVAARVADGLPGIDDRGAPLTVTASSHATIPSDGRPHRVPIAAFEAPAEHGLVLLPELARAAIRKVTSSNAGSTPILAGPVELVADGGLVGRSPVLFVAPGERFALGFGPDPAIRARRRADRVESKDKVLSRFSRTEHTVTVQLSNIGTQPRDLELTERIPVSEVEQVRVELDAAASSDGARADQDGFVRWQVELAAGARHTITLRYAVEKRKDVQEA